MGGEELLYGSSTTAAAFAAGEGWEGGSGKGITAGLEDSE